MLKNLFRLDGIPARHPTDAPMPEMSPGDIITDILFVDNKWLRKQIKKVTFRNVSISKMTLSQLTFTECAFENCIFIGSVFSEVEFHKCTIKNCTIWKSKFERCYLDPRVITLDRRYRIEASNVGISLFQSLLANYSAERQDMFFTLADIEFRRWKRYQLRYDIKQKKIERLSGEWDRFKSYFYDLVSGYGYKPVRLFLVTIGGFIIISLFNHVVIGGDLLVNGKRPDAASIIDSIYYSFSVLTILGFSSVVPDSAAAKLLTVFEALAAIGWLSIFTSVLVKRFLR